VKERRRCRADPAGDLAHHEARLLLLHHPNIARC
jgi:hypothetical protein